MSACSSALMFFPRAQARAEHAITTGDGQHVLRVKEYGSPAGEPVVYLHGGPGGGTPPDLPRLFDPGTFRLVAFDQRGCGQSVSEDRLRANTTALLVEDVETIRIALGIDRWAVMGSSYGSLLACLYAARHSVSIRWVLLHGVFLGSHNEVRWLFEADGVARFYPHQWARLKQAAEHAESEAAWRADDATMPPALVTAYHSLLTRNAVPRSHPPADGVDWTQPHAKGALDAAAALTQYEDDMETLVPCAASHEAAELLAGAQIAAHFFEHGCFLPAEGALPELTDARAALAKLPCAIVHGRHDVLCPLRSAYAVEQLWPGCTLRIVEGGAHALFEKPMRAAAQACLAQLVGGASEHGGHRFSRSAAGSGPATNQPEDGGPSRPAAAKKRARAPRDNA